MDTRLYAHWVKAMKDSRNATRRDPQRWDLEETRPAFILGTRGRHDWCEKLHEKIKRRIMKGRRIDPLWIGAET